MTEFMPVPTSPTSAATRITRVPLSDQRWHAFVADHRDATPLHAPAWGSFLAECYGFEAFALAHLDGGRVISGLPAVEVGFAPLMRPRWVSLPFTDACAPLLDASRSGLVHDVNKLRDDLGIASLEIRARVAGADGVGVGVTHQLTVSRDVDTISRGYRSSVRQGIRVAEREGVVVRYGESQRDLTQIFYDLHVRTRRRLGAPVQPRRYFRLLWERLIEGSHGFVLIAERRGVPLAAAVFLHDRRVMLYKYGASDERSWRLRANAALFHTAIGVAADNGLQVFDWGRTDHSDEGLRRFKRSWGAAEIPLVYTSFGASAPSHRAQVALAGVGRSLIRRSPEFVCRTMGSLFYKFAA